MIEELSNLVQPYAWGSRTALAQLRGEAEPSTTPEAELWMGAHPLAPSRLVVTGQSLPGAIESAPDQHLGSRVRGEYGAKLPFLLKVLAAGTPLSLQAHPSITQAQQGFAADEAANIPLDAAHRNYKDQNHKPELLCALGEFWALCGFREVSQTLALLDVLSLSALLPYRALLAAEPNEIGIAKAFSALMQAPPPLARSLAEATTLACRTRLAVGQLPRFADELGWVARLGELYPGDIGVVSSLLLNLLRLDVGEAVYLPAGNLHAYLGGTGVEIMASSDNVLRGGLTPKHVNVPELLRVLDFRPLHVEPLRPTTKGREHIYATPAREFRLSYFDADDGASVIDVSLDGPEIWLVTQGWFELASAQDPPVRLTASRSAFVSAATASLKVRGTGRIFRARVA